MILFAQVFIEACNKYPCILFLPRIETWWFVASDSLRATITGLLNDLQSSLPILFLATSDCEDLTESLSAVSDTLQIAKEACFCIKSPDYCTRCSYFKKVLEDCLNKSTKRTLGMSNALYFCY